MKEFEKIYLNYILDSRGNEVKIIFIGFILTINLAFYAGLYYIDSSFPFLLSELQVLVLLLLLAVNFLFSSKCVRENNLDRVITRYVKEEYVEKNILDDKHSQLRDVILNIRKTEKGNNKDDWENPINWMGRSWGATKGLLVIVNAVPLAALAFSLLSFQFCWSQSPYRAFTFIIVTILISFLIYLFVERFDLKKIN